MFCSKEKETRSKDRLGWYVCVLVGDIIHTHTRILLRRVVLMMGALNYCTHGRVQVARKPRERERASAVARVKNPMHTTRVSVPLFRGPFVLSTGTVYLNLLSLFLSLSSPWEKKSDALGKALSKKPLLCPDAAGRPIPWCAPDNSQWTKFIQTALFPFTVSQISSCLAIYTRISALAQRVTWKI